MTEKETKNIDSENVSLYDLAAMIEDGRNFAFTKFGDGEVTCMRRWFYGQNCDGDKYNLWLSRSLERAFVELAKREAAFIGKWHNHELVDYLVKLASKHGVDRINWVNYHFILNASPVAGVTDFDSFANDKMLRFVETIQRSNRKKIIFSNEDNAKLKDLFRADIFIETTKTNWSFKYAEYFEKTKKECADGAILIIAAGMCSKVMIADLLKIYDMTCIDIGSGFDLLASGKNSRSWSHTYQDELDYYKDILPTNW